MEHDNKLSYENLWKSIIRPPRAKYALKDLGMGKTGHCF